MDLKDMFDRMYENWNDKSPKVMGEWIFHKDKLTIENLVTTYVIWLEEIDSSAELLDWILQLESKPEGWDFENFVRLLVYAIDWNFRGSAQGVFCPSGNSKEDIKWRK
jgi:hypothetical protein